MVVLRLTLLLRDIGVIKALTGLHVDNIMLEIQKDIKALQHFIAEDMHIEADNRLVGRLYLHRYLV